MKWLFKNFMKKDNFLYWFGVILDVSGALVATIWPVAAAGKIIDIGIMQNNHNEMIRLFVLSIGKLILRIIDASKGKIYIDNNLIEDYTMSSVRDKIAYVAQTPFLFSDTIKNNVNFGNLDLSEDETRCYLKLAKADYVENLENGIETIIGENGISLSGGEKQRLSLARALAKKPQLLILDDITSALDYESELEVTNNINNLDYDCTKIIIAQKIISVKNADKIFVMKSGKIIGEGTHEELLKQCDMYKEIYDIQSGTKTKIEYI